MIAKTYDKIANRIRDFFDAVETKVQCGEAGDSIDHFRNLQRQSRALMDERCESLHRWTCYAVNRALSVEPIDPWCPVRWSENSHSELRLLSWLDFQFQEVTVECDYYIDITLAHELTRRNWSSLVEVRACMWHTSLIELGRMVTLLLLRSNRSLCSSRQFWISRLIS